MVSILQFHTSVFYSHTEKLHLHIIIIIIYLFIYLFFLNTPCPPYCPDPNQIHFLWNVMHKSNPKYP